MYPVYTGGSSNRFYEKLEVAGGGKRYKTKKGVGGLTVYHNFSVQYNEHRTLLLIC